MQANADGEPEKVLWWLKPFLTSRRRECEAVEILLDWSDAVVERDAW